MITSLVVSIFAATITALILYPSSPLGHLSSVPYLCVSIATTLVALILATYVFDTSKEEIEKKELDERFLRLKQQRTEFDEWISNLNVASNDLSRDQDVLLREQELSDS